MNGVKLHRCPDGHLWREHPDGTVGPSWGYGGTKCDFPGHDPMCCPEPARTDRQYRCPTCGTMNYAGRCHGPDNNWMHTGCEPPAPACLKRAVETKVWVPASRKRPVGENPWQPIPLEVDGQLELAVGA